jgi:fructose-bisphosphate aldolase class II
MWRTALQMISWGLEVNDYGNAILDDDGAFIKVDGEGVEPALWEEMKAYAADRGWSGGNYKKLNLPFENKLLGQPAAIRERMVKRVEKFVFTMLTEVLNAGDTAPLAVADILDKGACDPGPNATRIEDPAGWTPAEIERRAALIDSDKGEEGDFDD